MGVAIPQVITEDKAGGANILGGSLRFNSGSSHYLNRTFGTPTDNLKWTWSGWVKRSALGAYQVLFIGDDGSSNNFCYLRFSDVDKLECYQIVGGSYNLRLETSGVFRDPNAWYHIVLIYDSSNATSTDRVQIYVNGNRQTVSYIVGPFSPNTASQLNVNGRAHAIGRLLYSNIHYLSGYLTEINFIDGQALDSSYFGYTDPLTNTWRPKKLSSSVAFGTNGFYLPFDGNSPIGQDQSGRGNNWTPINFGGSNTIEKATGALPILNTDGGGKVARVGVRTDSNASSLVLALPLVGIKSDFSNAINGGTSNKTITANGNAAASSTQSNFYGGSFYFDGTSDYIDIAASSDFAFGTGDFTVECWIYTTNTTSDSFYRRIYLTDGPTGNANGNFQIALEPTTGKTNLWDGGAGGLNILGNSNVCNGVWHHIAGCRSGSTLRLFVDGVLESSTTYSDSISPNSGSPRPRIGSYNGTTGDFDGYIQDLRVYKGLAKYTQNFIPASTDPDILPDTPSGVAYSSNVALVPSTDGAVVFDGSGDSLTFTDNGDMNPGSGDFTLECFLNTTNLTGERHYSIIQKGNTASNNLYDWRLYFNDYGGSGFAGLWFDAACSGTSIGMQGVQNLRTNQWYHVAITRSSGTFRLFLNGIVEDTDSTTSNAIDNDYTGINIGYNDLGGAGPTYLEGFISNLHFVKGTALYTANFTPPTAPITSVANTKLLCCKSQTSATAFDVSPGTITANGNAAASNFNPFTRDINTVRGQESTYPTLSPLYYWSVLVYHSYTNNNRTITGTSAANSGQGYIPFPIKTGKWYIEMFVNSVSSGYLQIGLNVEDNFLKNGTGGEYGQPGYGTDSVNYGNNGTKYVNNTNSSYGSSWAAGDVIGMAVDADNGAVYFSRNGVYQAGGDPLSGASKTGSPFTWTGGSKTYMAGVAVYTTGASGTINTGQNPFKFPPPAGFQPLALANTPRPTIVRPDQYVGVTTYVGNESSRTINCGFKPDLVWIKERGGAGYHHALYDSVRGPLKSLSSSRIDIAEQTETEGLNLFASNGFSFAGGGPGFYYVNRIGGNYVAWCWKAGGNSNTYNINDVGYATTTAAGLTAGTIAPTGASINTKSGFSIITYTGNATSGATVSHGLGTTPAMVIIKSRSVTTNWYVWHQGLTQPDYQIYLNLTNGQDTSVTTFLNDKAPTSSVFELPGTGLGSNNSAATYIAYCWAEIPGFSKFGTFTGNASTDGVFVFCGFKPALVICKRSDTTAGESWSIWDNKRAGYNPAQYYLAANSEAVEDTTAPGNNSNGGPDFLSNGFKFRGYNGSSNNSCPYIFAAWAETPAANLFGGQSNAR